MRVYIVRKIIDHEYGCRNVEAVFSSYESAEAFVQNSHANFEYEFWDGSKASNITIEVYEVIS